MKLTPTTVHDLIVGADAQVAALDEPLKGAKDLFQLLEAQSQGSALFAQLLREAERSPSSLDGFDEGLPAVYFWARAPLTTPFDPTSRLFHIRGAESVGFPKAREFSAIDAVRLYWVPGAPASPTLMAQPVALHLDSRWASLQGKPVPVRIADMPPLH